MVQMELTRVNASIILDITTKQNNDQRPQHCWSFIKLKGYRKLLDPVTSVLVRYQPFKKKNSNKTAALGCSCVFALRFVLIKFGFVL